MSDKIYNGDGINVSYNAGRCIHAAECVHGLGKVFDPEKRPWIQPANATADEIAEVVQRCPTGALHFQRLDGGIAEPTPDHNTITPDPNGALYLRGDLHLKTAQGEITDTRMALCRCGGSSNKPFCDGTHRKNNFSDSGALGDNKVSPTETDVTTLTINPAENGPLLLNGSMKISSSDGQTIYEGSKTALCRCGASSNKPFCDGTHTKIGFQG